MSSAAAESAAGWHLRVPETLADTGVHETLIIDLFLKHLFHAGTGSLKGLSGTLKLPVEMVESIFHRLKSQNLIEVKGMHGDDFRLCLSLAGKNLASDRMQVSRYMGPVPVPLERYEEAVRAQVSRTKVNRTLLNQAYGDLSLEPELLDRLGPALVSCKSMFLFGPSGTGKSSLAERLLRIFDEMIAIPYAIEVDGIVITFFDAAVHRPVPNPPRYHDPRWVYCSRPCIIVGGELVPAMLELQRDSESGTYVAPLHMKANNGVFVIDDFGRQLISPRDLLNRWIVPLDRRMDFLTMGSGVKFAIPFEVFVVFSTNLNPSELADEAFLRRIPNKILVAAVSAQVFDNIVMRRLEAGGWSAAPAALEHLRAVCQARGGDLRPCYPRDILGIISSVAEFEERPVLITPPEIDRAADLYFSSV